MTITKRMVVLANSVKHAPGRCVAGREMISEEETPVRLGGWLRPVSLMGEGELYAQHCRIDGGGGINLFDVLDVPLDGPANDPTQPENWLIGQQAVWRRVGTLPPERLPDFYENPDGLWIEPGANSDRASQAFIAQHPPRQSLYVIRLIDPAIWPDGGSHRLAFRYRDVRYSLKITDPLLPAGETNAKPTAACISLTPPFTGRYLNGVFHFKVVASLFW